MNKTGQQIAYELFYKEIKTKMDEILEIIPMCNLEQIDDIFAYLGVLRNKLPKIVKIERRAL